MTIYSGIFNSVNGDRKYNAWWFAKYFATFIGNGVFPNPSSNLQVAAYQNMKVVVKPGSGWIDGYFIFSDGDHVVSLDVADGVLKRIDRVVMRLNHLTRKIEIVVKKGTFASNPVAPTLQRDADAYELALADVLINNGVTQITQANITDQRLNSALCGIVHGTVNQVDTTTIFNQYQAWFNDVKGSVAGELVAFQEIQEQEFLTWFESIKDILEGDVAANLAARIANLEQGLANHIAEVSHIKWIETVGGTANALIATDTEITSYKNGLAVSFPATSNSTAAVTLNINGLGAIPIKKANGTAFSNAKANGVYTVRYRAGAFILQGEGGGGNAQPNEVLSGKTFTNDNGESTGTMQNNSNAIITPQSTDITLTEGYYKNAVVKGVFTVPVIADYGFEVFNQGSYVQTSSLAYTPVIRMTWLAGDGTIRLTHGMYAQYNYAIYSQVYINGVAVGIERQSSSTDIYEWTQDFNVKKGDVIEIRARANTNAIAYIVRTAIKIRSFYLVNRTM
ncbi:MULTISPECIES: hypothetical protein [Lysinibacillus]|uniref:hypothetical protein n=1 Tax=Lysinibacillus TaxID=400634 RepID=UPI000694D655|nr:MULTISPECIES: hypothetical protein [Lysinibacillus]